MNSIYNEINLYGNFNSFALLEMLDLKQIQQE
jgi:hypothetical protein